MPGSRAQHEYQITACRPEDMGLIQACHASCCPDKHWDLPSLQRMFANPATHVFLALGGRQCLGFCIFTQVRETAEIISIGVAEEQRRNGIATALMAEARAYLSSHGCCSMTLEVAADNIPAQSLYQNFGFTRAGIRKNYYMRQDGPADAVRYRLEISRPRR